MTIRSIRSGAVGYPSLLAQIPDPPTRLWLRGEAGLEVLDRPAVAIVGARACSGYGRAVARLLATEVAVVPGGHIVLWDAYEETAAAIDSFLGATRA